MIRYRLRESTQKSPREIASSLLFSSYTAHHIVNWLMRQIYVWSHKMQSLTFSIKCKSKPPQQTNIENKILKWLEIEMLIKMVNKEKLCRSRYFRIPKSTRNLETVLSSAKLKYNKCHQRCIWTNDLTRDFTYKLWTPTISTWTKLGGNNKVSRDHLFLPRQFSLFSLKFLFSLFQILWKVQRGQKNVTKRLKASTIAPT